MLPELEYIKQTRIKLGITQRKLAQLSNLSTSMINQIETGRCKPSYDSAKKLFEILNSLDGNSSRTAGDICSKKIIFANKEELVNDILEKMRKNFVSQVPILENHKIIGIVSEDCLARKILENNEKKLKNITAELVMDSPPPVVDILTPTKVLLPLIRFSKCIIVTEKGNLIGIITATDILKIME